MSTKSKPPRLNPGEKVLLELLAKIRLRIRSEKSPAPQTQGKQHPARSETKTDPQQ